MRIIRIVRKGLQALDDQLVKRLFGTDEFDNLNENMKRSIQESDALLDKHNKSGE